MFMKRIFLSIAVMGGALIAANAANITGIDNSHQNQAMAIGYTRLSTTDSITALAGGGQTGAPVMNSALNRVTTVATGNDSVALPLCQAGPAAAVGGNPKQPVNTIGQMIYVINAAASNSMNVFPSSGGSINALTANSAYAVAANKTVGFACIGSIWYSLLGG